MSQADWAYLVSVFHLFYTKIPNFQSAQFTDQNLSEISWCACDSLTWNSHNINNFNIGWWSSVKWPHLLIHSTRYGCSVNLHWSHCTTITSWDSTVDMHGLQILICLEHLFVCLFLTVGTQWTKWTGYGCYVNLHWSH